MVSVISGWSFAWFVVNSETGINTPQLVQRFAVPEENSLRAVNFVPFSVLVCKQERFDFHVFSLRYCVSLCHDGHFPFHCIVS